MIDEPTPPEDRALLDAIAAIPKPDPPAALSHNFRAQLEAEPAFARSHRPRMYIAVAAILVLALGTAWWRDRVRELSEIAKLQTAVAQLSVTSRYEWVAGVADSGGANSGVVAALTRALLTDSSTNVRVAAAEALGRIATPAALRQAAESSIRNDPSPFVQSALLSAISRLPEKDRAALLHTLLARPDLDPIVRAEAEVRSRT